MRTRRYVGRTGVVDTVRSPDPRPVGQNSYPSAEPNPRGCHCQGREFPNSASIVRPNMSADRGTLPDSLPHAGPTATLTRELSDFLVLFSISLNKYSFYPNGHPQLRGAATEVLDSVRSLLVERPTVALGVAKQQLVIEGVATDSSHPLLRELADRLHRHQIGAIQFSEGVREADVHNLLQALAVDPDRSDSPLGLDPDTGAGFGRIALHTLDFGQLTLVDPNVDGAGGGASGLGADLWVGLARAALEADHGAPDDDRMQDPVALATAIESHDREVAYDQVIVGYLLQISDELRRGRDAESTVLRDRVSRLIGSLRPQTLARLLEMGGDTVQRRRFLLDASQSVAVDAVVELVEAAALTSGQTISHAMARLLHKLAAQATGSGDSSSSADGALREQVRRLVRGWSLDDPNPDEYRQILDRMARATPELVSSTGEAVSEAERIVAMSLELDLVEEPTRRAVADLVGSGSVSKVIALLQGAPDDRQAIGQIWALLVDREQFSSVLSQEPLDPAMLDQLVQMAGIGAIEPLLDALTNSAARGTRRLVLEHLVALGTAAAEAAVGRLPGAPWYVARNVLILVRRTGVLPQEWSPSEWAQHEDSRVRREAIRLMLDHPSWRERAIVMGIRDDDATVARAALISAAHGCPRSAVAPALRRLREGTFDDELAPLAIRALAASGTREGLELAINTTLERTFFGRPRLAHPSPDVIAALSGLAACWHDEPRASTVLALASKHFDAEVRAAATVPETGQ